MHLSLRLSIRWKCIRFGGRRSLERCCGEYKIHVSAYSPLGGPGNPSGSKAVVDNPVIQSIAHKHNATPAQVALSWGLSKGASLVTKSFDQGRMTENMEAMNLSLDEKM